MFDVSYKMKGRPQAWLAVVAMVMAGLAGCGTPSKKSEADKTLIAFPSPPDPPRYFWERAISSSADVVAEDRDGALRRAITGEGRSGESLLKPYGVAVHQGRIFVTDSADRGVKVFDVAESKYYKIAVNPPGNVQKALGIDVDKHGTVYVADVTAKTIVVMDRDGNFLRYIGEKGTFDRLTSVTVDPDGERVFAVDIGGIKSEKHWVRVFDAKTGKHLFDIGKRGTEPGEFNLPRDLAIGKDRRLYVVDGGNFRVQVFDWDGKYLSSFGKPGRQLGDFARPKEIATDPEGNVYVIDAAFGNFQIFDPDGKLLMFIGDRGNENGPAVYMLPSGIYVDDEGRVYAVDQWFRRVDVFRPAGMPEGAGSFAPKPPAVASQK